VVPKSLSLRQPSGSRVADSGRPLSRSTVNKLVGEVNHGIVDGNPSKQTVPDSQRVCCNEAIPTMRIV